MNKEVLITGISSGIGEAIAKELLKIGGFNIIGLYIGEQSFDLGEDVDQIECDLSYEGEIINKVGSCGFDIIIHAAGINYINWVENTPTSMFDLLYKVNARAIFFLAKIFYESLKSRKGTMLNIVSNASHMPMTNSIAYNASKGAAHIMTLQLARELGPNGVTVFGISPNRVGDTKMSEYIDSSVCHLRGWTPDEAREYQLKALPAGEETNKDTLGEFVAFLLSTKQRHKYLAGTIIPYGK
jgi:NAD(P)-dependent dehydrogenase (short-subunit alcohol dehydrogenase family)